MARMKKFDPRSVNVYYRKDIADTLDGLIMSKKVNKAQYPHFVENLKNFIAQTWGSLPTKRRLDKDNTYKNEKNVVLKNQRLLSPNVLSGSTNCMLDGCYIYGTKALNPQKGARLSNCFVIGQGVIQGSNWVGKRKLNVRQYAGLASVKDKLFPGDPALVTPENVFDGLSEYAESISDARLKEIMAYLQQRRQDVRSKYRSIIGALMKEYHRDVRDGLIEDSGEYTKLKVNKLIAAAFEIDSILEPLSHRIEMFEIDIYNSIIFGNDSCSNIMGGRIRNSIIAGSSVLKGSHVEIHNSILIDEHRTENIDMAKIGNPDVFRDNFELSGKALSIEKDYYKMIANY
ncbi:MAG: hypothetical protein GY859_17255 [Desulfobacterales bacterium]|nr:hypothetical protein [Desulfobacterales bacterium]